MAKRKCKFVQGSYYHVYNRGASRQPIFRNDENYLFLLRKFGPLSVEKNISVLAYCLMPNHYHFLLRQDGDVEINELMQAVFNSYVKAFNSMCNRSGVLFEGPFKSIHVDKETYLVYLCRYIHRNPLEAHLVADLGQWPHSNYLEWIGRRKGRLVDKDFIKSYFDKTSDYEAFVLETDVDKKISAGLRAYTLGK